METDEKSVIKDEVLNWLATGDTGLSSKTIAFATCGIKYPDSYYPRDPSDFKRCLEMLEACPSIKDLLCVKSLHKNWVRFVDSWDLMVEMYNEDVAKTPGRCPRLYKFMRKLDAQVHFDAGKVLYDCTYKKLEYAFKSTGIKPTFDNCHIYADLVDEKRKANRGK